MRRFLVFLLSCCVLTGLHVPEGWAGDVVLASTSLVGAIAKAAGAGEVRVLTPENSIHPPEYDLKPSDVKKFEGVSLVVHGGYERMVLKVLEVSRERRVTAIQIDTETAPQNLMSQARRIAKILGTEREERAWEERFGSRLNALQGRLADFADKRSIVHRFALPFSQWVGLKVVQVVSPGELSPKAIAVAIGLRPDLVVDVLHLPAAKVIASQARCRYVQIINFPGAGRAATLEEMFESNVDELLKAAN